MKTYNDLRQLRTFEERFNYLKLGGSVGRATFGFERYLNQLLYHSGEWKQTRSNIIIRDSGCDLGYLDRDIFSNILIHHINPITIKDIENHNACLFDPNNLICTCHNTHQAIHYGDEGLLTRLPQSRKTGDTKLW